MLGPTHRAFGAAAVTGVYAVTKPWLPPDTFPIIGLQLGLLQGGGHSLAVPYPISTRNWGQHIEELPIPFGLSDFLACSPVDRQIHIYLPFVWD